MQTEMIQTTNPASKCSNVKTLGSFVLIVVIVMKMIFYEMIDDPSGH